MQRTSSLAVEQRAASIELFGEGLGSKSVARRFGASLWAVDRFYDRWRVRGVRPW